MFYCATFPKLYISQILRKLCLIVCIYNKMIAVTLALARQRSLAFFKYVLRFYFY